MLQTININNIYRSKTKGKFKIIKATAKVSMLFTRWNVHYVINNMKEQQNLGLTLV